MHKNVKNIEGMKFNRLQVISFSDSVKNKAYWLCRCDCGNEVIVSGSALISENTKSCGCRKRESASVRFTKHKMTDTKLYSVWNAMKKRCSNVNNSDYKYYGGKGISVCDEWKNDFINFYKWSIENGFSNNLTIDRINSDKNYEPSNCRWITMYEQVNNKNNTMKIEYNGEIKSISDWCKIYNMQHWTIYNRIIRGWDPLKAFTYPEKKKGCANGIKRISEVSNK